MKGEIFMEPVSSIGKYGKFFLLFLGIALLIIGISATAVHYPSSEMTPCTATITSFSLKTSLKNSSSDEVSEAKTLVSYTFKGKKYENIELNQIESSWQTGNQIIIYCDNNNPTNIRTGTMSYGGFLIILLSLPFILISSYMIITTKRQPNKSDDYDNSETEEKTVKIKLKYKAGSIIIPLSAGIPIMLMGIILLSFENHSALAWLMIVLGFFASSAGIRSLIMYFEIKNNPPK